MKSNWTIRKAVESDASALTACMRAAYEPYIERLSGEELPPLTVDYEEEIRTNEVWVAESEKELVGALVLMEGSDYLKIANIAVQPEFQGNGLGRGLIDFAEKKAAQVGYSEIRLVTHVLLTENVSLYGYLDWAEYDRDESRIYMSKRTAVRETNT